jgi:hypothetical protein
MIMRRIFERWHHTHPDWPVIQNAQTTTHAPMIRVPAIRLDGIDLGPAWFTERPNRNFATIMSSMTADRCREVPSVASLPPKTS